MCHTGQKFHAFICISCTDHEGTVEKRLATRPQHIERLQKLNDEGRLIVAGAMPKDLLILRQVFMAVL